MTTHTTEQAPEACIEKALARMCKEEIEWAYLCYWEDTILWETDSIP